MDLKKKVRKTEKEFIWGKYESKRQYNNQGKRREK